MNFYLSICFTFLSLASIGQNDWMDTTYHQNQVIATVGILNILDSSWTRYSYYENGVIAEIHHYEKDTVTPTGQWQGFLPNGNLIYSCQYQEWNLHGYFYEYYSDGSLKLKGEFYNGYKTGIWDEFDYQSNLISSTEYNLSTKDSTNARINKGELTELIIQFPDIPYSYYIDEIGNTVTQSSGIEIKLSAYEPRKKKHLLTKPKTN